MITDLLHHKVHTTLWCRMFTLYSIDDGKGKWTWWSRGSISSKFFATIKKSTYNILVLFSNLVMHVQLLNTHI